MISPPVAVIDIDPSVVDFIPERIDPQASSI